MSTVPLAVARLTQAQLSRLAAEEPDLRWPRAFRSMVERPRERSGDPGDPRDPREPGAIVYDALPGQFSHPETAPLLMRALRAFGRPRLRLRVVLRQGRLLTLIEVAADADRCAGALSTLLLDGDPTASPPHARQVGVRQVEVRQVEVRQVGVRQVGRVELAGTAASALPALSLRHVPGAGAVPSRRPEAAAPGRPGAHPARTLVLRGWGRALTRPFVDAWAQDEHGWVRPGDVASATPRGSGATTRTGWIPVDADRFATDLAALLRDPSWHSARRVNGDDDE